MLDKKAVCGYWESHSLYMIIMVICIVTRCRPRDVIYCNICCSQPSPEPGDVQEISSTYYFTIFNGNIACTAPSYQAFREHYHLSWGRILYFLEQLNKKLREYNVPVAIVEGKKVAELASDFEFVRNPTWEYFLAVLKNKALVEDIIRRPGQKYKGPDGQQMAAIKIQSLWRRYRDRIVYFKYRRLKWAASIIAISWILHCQLKRVKNILKQSRQRHLVNFRTRAKHLVTHWNHIKASRRTIIHIPSLGIALLPADSSTTSIIHHITDDKVDVIYVSPVTLDDDIYQYYSKLFDLHEALKFAKPERVSNMEHRFNVVTPEGIHTFPTHHMCLATHLKYSPQTIKRIKNLIRGKEAYIVGGFLHKDDLAVADMLNVPILGPDPDVVHLYSSKSGSKRIFASASVPTPPGEYDIYNLQQMYEVLTQLVIDNLEIKRWLFKMDLEFGGEALPTVTSSLLSLVCFVPQEPIYLKVIEELPEILTLHSRMVNKELFPTWEKFLDVFLGQGGVIEAFAPSQSVTNLTVDMLIEPTGEISMVSCGDQIHATSPLQCWGASVPQCSVNPGNLHSMCVEIARACKSRGVMGYFSVDLVTFIHPFTMQQQVWATDLDLCYSDHLAMTQLMLYITDGSLDLKANMLHVPPAFHETKTQRHMGEEEKQLPVTRRFAVLSTQLEHSSLSVVHYNVFLQMCKAHGIGYDVKARQGTFFTFHESHKREHLGMITIGEELHGALVTFARNLSVIHQEISAPSMQGKNNFKVRPSFVCFCGDFVDDYKSDQRSSPARRSD
uniref:IQ motif containing H n=1 Tax=Callorhinchus milii TaxID=7868 RepID=A0A4W3J7B9_CALMI